MERKRAEKYQKQECVSRVYHGSLYATVLEGKNRDDQEGGMLVYNHGARSAHVSQMMELRHGKQAGSGSPDSRQGAGRVLH